MKKKQETMTDWHRADIVARLKKAGWSVRALSIQANLAPNTLGKALDAPYLKGEKIIALAFRDWEGDYSCCNRSAGRRDLAF